MILVTGCTGYIGWHLVQALLKRGEKVRGLVLPQEARQAEDLARAGMQVWAGDILLPQTLQGMSQDVQIIYHLVGLHSASLQRMENVYLQGTRNLLQACADTDLQACIFASNGAVYRPEDENWLTEESATEPQHPFGRIIDGMEKVALGAWKTHRFPSVLVRIAEVYGPGMLNPVTQLQQTSFHLLGNGQNWTSHIHIHDLVAVLQCIGAQTQAGKIYNLTDDLPLRQKDFYLLLAKLAEAPLPQWMPLDGVAERIRISLHGLRALSLRMSNEKVKNELYRSFRYPTVRDGIEACILAAQRGARSLWEGCAPV